MQGSECITAQEKNQHKSSKKRSEAPPRRMEENSGLVYESTWIRRSFLNRKERGGGRGGMPRDGGAGASRCVDVQRAFVFHLLDLSFEDFDRH